MFIEFARRFSALGSTSTGTMNISEINKDAFENISRYIKTLHSENEKEYKRLGYDLGGNIMT